MQFAGVALSDPIDMRVEHALDLAAGQALEPVRCIVVPDQRMAVHELAVRLGFRDDRVREAELESVGRWAQPVELHRVFRRQDLRLASVKLDIGGVVERLLADRGAIDDARRRRGFGERGRAGRRPHAAQSGDHSRRTGENAAPGDHRLANPSSQADRPRSPTVSITMNRSVALNVCMPPGGMNRRIAVWRNFPGPNSSTRQSARPEP